jgi:hypothetical protein
MTLSLHIIHAKKYIQLNLAASLRKILFCGIVAVILLFITMTDSLCGEVKSQSNEITASQKTWSYITGEPGYEQTHAVLQTTEGDFIIIGEANSSFGAKSNQAIIIKLDGEGNRKWVTLLGEGTHADSIQQTIDGGFIIVGDKLTSDYAKSDYGPFAEQNVWMLKINKDGDWEWEKIYGSENYEAANKVLQINNDGYIVSGRRTNNDTDVILIKTDVNGNEIWTKTYGGKGNDFINCIRQTSEGGFIIAGGTSSIGEGGADMWILKLDKNGNQEGERFFGGTYDDIAKSIIETQDGGYVVAGDSQSFGNGKTDARIIKFDFLGKVIWTRTYGGKEDDRIYSFEVTTDGGFIGAGYTESSGAGSHDVWILKLDASGNKEWERLYGGKDWDDAESVQQTKDGGFVIGATTLSFGKVRSADIWVLKIDSKGNCNECF